MFVYIKNILRTYLDAEASIGDGPLGGLGFSHVAISMSTQSKN